MAIQRVKPVIYLCTLATLAATVTGLKCWQCGQYSDGVGSITPCTNSTGARLGTCGTEHKFCIKYVSELTTVRDCVPTCIEKEWWGARTFCCDTDECNAGTTNKFSVSLLISIIAFLFTQ